MKDEGTLGSKIQKQEVNFLSKTEIMPELRSIAQLLTQKRVGCLFIKLCCRTLVIWSSTNSFCITCMKTVLISLAFLQKTTLSLPTFFPFLLRRH